ncbi:MAG TPA: ferrochelatase [Dissulfurispiraceae bacterium]|nr:ferrochelatase [Dissulfurispiraceae bacterium]
MIGVILLNLGGPDAPAAVKPFLYNLFSDRDIIKLGPRPLQKPIAALIAHFRASKTTAMYQKIGGGSPILPITAAQENALAGMLKEIMPNTPFVTSIGMRYWHPFIADAVDKLYSRGVRKFIALNLYPQYSIATSGSSMKAFAAALSRHQGCSIAEVRPWHLHPKYLDALAAGIQSSMSEFVERPVVLFSAHSLPQSFIDSGDPYLTQTQETVQAIAERLALDSRLSFQSRSGPVKWLEPSTESMLKSIADEGIWNVLIVPISFVSDHIETLYEIDIEYQELAHRLGITMKRTPSLNTAPQFIEALAEIVLTTAKENNWL